MKLPVFLITAIVCFLTQQVLLLAGPVANWKEFNPAVAPFTSGLDTDAPTFGDGTNANAQGSWIAGRFGTVALPQTVTLAVGQTLTVTGSYVLTGGAAGDSDYRHGIFNDGGQFDANNGSNWIGGWLHQTGTDLYQGRTSGPFISSAANAVALGAVKTSSGSLVKDSPVPVTFRMSVTRDSETTVDIVSSLTGGGGSINQLYTKDDQPTTNFTYTCAGLLFGGVSSLDRVVFSDVRFSVSPEPSALRITAISRSVVADPANVIVWVTFTSDEAKTYTLFRSEDFDLPVDSRTDVDDSIAGEPGSDTTTFEVDFNAFGIPLDARQQFFVVKENP